MPRTIEYCLHNVDSATRSRLRELDEPTVVEQRCLQRCGTCYEDSFLVVDGECEAGPSHADLLPALPEETE